MPQQHQRDIRVKVYDVRRPTKTRQVVNTERGTPRKIESALYFSLTSTL